jgi:hypothetical protein
MKGDFGGRSWRLWPPFLFVCEEKRRPVGASRT